MTPEETTVLVQAIVADAQRLGLIWTMRLATVSTTDPLTGTYDGDDTSVPLIDMIGARVGQRVWVIGIPQGGNYVIGWAPGATLIQTYGLHGTGISDSVASSSYTNMAAPSSFTYVKKHDLTATRIQMTVGFFTNSAASGLDAGVTFDGGATTVQVVKYGATISTGVHLQGTGVQNVPIYGASAAPMPAGTYTVQGRWRRSAGAGTISRDAQDWLSIECIETAPEPFV